MEPITHFQSAPKYLERTTKPEGYYGLTRNLLIRRPCALHDLALPQCKLHDDTTYRLWFLPEPYTGFEAQTYKPSTGGFEAHPTKPLDTCHRHAQPPSRQVFRCLCLTYPSAVLTWPTRSLQCTLKLVDDPRCQLPMVGHPASPVPRSKPPTFVLHRTTPSPSAWTRLSFTFAVNQRLRAPHLRTTSKRHVAGQTNASVSSTTQPKTLHSLAITHHKPNHKGTYPTTSIRHVSFFIFHDQLIN
jgi:hypothetical protein